MVDLSDEGRRRDVKVALAALSRQPRLVRSVRRL